MKYLFIDANNLACRCAFANPELSNKEGVPTGVHYGFFNSLVLTRKTFGKDYQYLIVWDGKSKRRVAEAEAAVAKGLIRSGYKANRTKEEQPKPLADFIIQAPVLQRAIGETGIPQIRLPEYESDDVIASYCNKLKSNNSITIITSDKDYYQLLDRNVLLYDGMKQKFTAKDDYVKEFGIEPLQHVDVGALMGDDGDNIFGVPGWGDKTSLKMIKKYGTWQKVVDFLKQSYKNERNKYPDLNTVPGGDQMFKEISEIKSEKGKVIYPEIKFDMPYTGVLYGFDKGKVTGSKAEIMALVFEERIKLAYSLKKMDCDIPNLPEIVPGQCNQERILEYFSYCDINSLQGDISVFS